VDTYQSRIQIVKSRSDRKGLVGYPGYGGVAVLTLYLDIEGCEKYLKDPGDIPQSDNEKSVQRLNCGLHNRIGPIPKGNGTALHIDLLPPKP
jgi:hypothetical protein